MEFFHLVERYASADELERDRIRDRLDGYQRFGQHSRGSYIPATVRSPTLSALRRSFSGSVWLTDVSLQPMQPKFDVDDDTYKRRLSERATKRTLWESTLPEAVVDHPGDIRSGYDYDYITHGKGEVIPYSRRIKHSSPPPTTRRNPLSYLLPSELR